MDEDGQEGGFMGDGIHTPDQPYCDDIACWCHTDVLYHEAVTEWPYSDEDIARVYTFYELL